MSDSGAEPDTAQLAALRARLYAPGSTTADRERYQALLSQASPAGRTDHDAPDADGEAGPPADRAVGRVRLPRPATVVAVVLALVVGAAGGVAASTRSADLKPTAAAATATARSETAPTVPTPIAAAPITTSIGEQRAGAAALVKVLAASTPSVLSRVFAETGPHTDAAWARAVGCSLSTSIGGVSPDGAPSRFSTAAGETSARPTGTRFRVTIHLTRAADWSWVIDGTRTGATTTVLTVGAGGAASGPAQYAEFAQRGSTVVTAATISTSPTTPFVWQVESCTPD